jgi:hypothetical protein
MWPSTPGRLPSGRLTTGVAHQCRGARCDGWSRRLARRRSGRRASGDRVRDPVPISTPGPRRGRKCTDPPHECGGSGATGAIRSRTLPVGLGGWRLRGLHREAGGLPPDVVSSLHALPAPGLYSGNCRGFYERTPSEGPLRRETAAIYARHHAEKHVPPTHRAKSRLSNLPPDAPCFSRSSGTGTTQGDIDMARQTKMKIAALATAIVATLGMAAVSPATASDSGKTTINMRGGGDAWCC